MVIIKSILCSNGCVKKDCLVKLIPSKVSITTQNTNILVSLSPLTDFVEEIIGRTIALERKVVLMELLEPDRIKRVALRTILREITIHIEYIDIYGERYLLQNENLHFGEEHFRK